MGTEDRILGDGGWGRLRINEIVFSAESMIREGFGGQNLFSQLSEFLATQCISCILSAKGTS